jgi:hypothetical protein
MTITLGDLLRPSELVDRKGHPLVCQHILRFAFPFFQAHPGQIHPWLLERLGACDAPTGSDVSSATTDVGTGEPS